MTNEDVARLAWNDWRAQNRGRSVDLGEARLTEANRPAVLPVSGELRFRLIMVRTGSPRRAGVFGSACICRVKRDKNIG